MPQSRRVIDHASRTFLVDVDDGQELRKLSSELVNSWADEAQVAWDFANIGFVQVDDHDVAECQDDESASLPVVQFGDEARGVEKREQE